jgi:primase-polymerase (primpol)-like protein
MRREKTQINKIRNRKEEITNNKEIRESSGTTLRTYIQILENLEEDLYTHTKLNQEDINHLNRSITHNEIEAAIVSPKEKPRT